MGKRGRGGLGEEGGGQEKFFPSPLISSSSSPHLSSSFSPHSPIFTLPSSHPPLFFHSKRRPRGAKGGARTGGPRGPRGREGGESGPFVRREAGVVTGGGGRPGPRRRWGALFAVFFSFSLMDLTC